MKINRDEIATACVKALVRLEKTNKHIYFGSGFEEGVKYAESKLKNNGDLVDVSESLSFDGMVINPIDKDGEFEITMNHYSDDAYHYLTTDEAKRLILYLQQSLNSR